MWAFNPRIDDIQVRLRANSSEAATRLAFYASDYDYPHLPHDLSDGITRDFRCYGTCDPLSHEDMRHQAILRCSIRREPLFWSERARDGTVAHLLTVNLYFTAQTLTGIEFRYELGLSRAFGSAAGQVHAFELGQGERLSVLVVQESHNEITGIEVFAPLPNLPLLFFCWALRNTV